jgi:hypothetical protein
MKKTKYLPPEGMKYRVKTDIIWELHNMPGHYYTFLNMSLWPEIFSLENVQESAIEHGIDIFEKKKTKP